MEDNGSVSTSEIIWKDIEMAQINVIKEAFRLRYKKDSKLIEEYAGYVRVLRQEENPDDYVRSVTIMLFPDEEAYNRRMDRYRKWYKHKKGLLASIENLYSLYYILSKEGCHMSEGEINEATEELFKNESV